MESSFERAFNAAVVAYCEYGIRESCSYKNIMASDLKAQFRVANGVKNGNHLLRAPLKLNKLGYCLPRGKENIEENATVIIIDCDQSIINRTEIDGAPDPFVVHKILKEADIGHYLFATHSHYEGNKGNRYRVILATNKPYTQAQLPPTVESLIALINDGLDDQLLVCAKENFTYAQGFYLPRRSKDVIPEIYYEYLLGSTVDVLDPLPEEPSKSYIQSANSDRIASNLLKNQLSPIAEFNNQNRITDLLSIYGYKQVRNRWLSPYSKSKQPGITVDFKKNKFFSHHASPPFNDGYWHDCFDLMQISEGLTHVQAVKSAAYNTIAPDGATVDQYNKKIFKENRDGR